MDAFLAAMTWPFLACVVLVGIHVWLGIHVLERGIVFVDLALAQIAALGAVVAISLGWDVHEHPAQVTAFSFGFACVGALGFGMLRSDARATQKEAIIGVCYVGALAAGVMISSRSVAGREGVESLLLGSILWITPPSLGKAVVVYGTVGVVHALLRRPLWRLSRAHAEGQSAGRSGRLLDLLFYGGFAAVVTSSVQIGGVPLVFALLIIPAVCATGWCATPGRRLLFAWLFGLVASAMGLVASWEVDAPAGPSVVVTLVAMLIVSASLRALLRSEHRSRTLARQLGLLGLGSVGWWLLPKLSAPPHTHSPTATSVGSTAEIRRDFVSSDPRRRLAAVEDWPDLGDGSIGLPLRLLGDEHPEIRRAAAQTLGLLGDPGAVAGLWAAAPSEPTIEVRRALDRSLLELGDPRGLQGPLERLESRPFEADLRLLQTYLPLEQAAAVSEWTEAGIARVVAWLDGAQFDLVLSSGGRFRLER